MNIARNNYEEFFMLYADNELPASQRKEVEAFIAANPDLAQELALFQQFRATPDATVVFENKAVLLKPEHDAVAGITLANHESFFVLYTDNELTGLERAAVADFVYQHPELQEAFESMQQAKLQPDNNLVFANKESLYRKEKDDHIVPFRWWRMAAAAAVMLLVAGLFWLNKDKQHGGTVVALKPAVEKIPVPLLPATKDTSVQYRVQASMPVVAAAIDRKKDPQEKNIATAGAKVLLQKGRSHTGSSHAVVHQPVTEEAVAVLNKADIKSTTVTSKQETTITAEIDGRVIAAAKPPVIDQPAIVLHPDEQNSTGTITSFNSDNVQVLNTSVNTKNALRGFLRKATRLVAKQTNAGNEDGNRKAILIGGFEIAVR